ncbi:hypothetical protein [Caulobacter sp. 17J80-11]|uniref:hypothetical protein n=1 Tax=Caulobacter sp. 17J80-11 TaxID=2763502 RepID=UPI001653E525|nr:hypothetical protein [Caulobacter sp. 17J80-11]MBC6982110.1 hypothetical protein [Caulobacter sp. 17J80-11]
MLLREAEVASPWPPWVGDPQRLRGEIAIRGIQGLVWWSLAIGLCVLLATRPIGVTYDDTNYLAAFDPDFEHFRSWWLFLIEEPGWQLLTVILSPLRDELGYRVVLLLSPAAFILAANKITGGRWLAVGWWSWLIIAALILDRGLGVGLYVAAIRQGLATSLFLLLVALRAPVVAAALLAGTVHTSFLVVAGIVGLVQFGARDPRIAAAVTGAIALYGVLLALGVAASPFGSLDLGRRTTTYELASGLNLLGYTALIIQYGGTLLLARDTRSPWLGGTLVFAAAGAALSIVNAGFVRIFLSLNAFMLMALAQSPPKRRVLAIGYWFAVMVAATLWADRNAVSARDSWIGLWSLVLGR